MPMTHLNREMRRIYHAMSPTMRVGMTVEQLVKLAGGQYWF